MKADAEESRLAESQRLDALLRRHEYDRRKWLQSRGWEQTCETPGSYWMWMRMWAGRQGGKPMLILVDTGTAERIQTEWDQQADYEMHPENYEE
jgi:hypothetical protein